MSGKTIDDTLTNLSMFIDSLICIGCLTDEEIQNIEEIETELYRYVKKEKKTTI